MDGGQEIGGALHRFSVHDYQRMAEAGLFGIDARVELIRGTVRDLPAIGTPHLWTVNRLTMLFATRLAGRAIVSVQNSIRILDHSEPEPDVVLLSPTADQTAHPGPADVLLVVEVSDSTISYDRDVKGPLYAEAGIGEYWLVNLPDRAVEVHREPGADGYRQVARATAGILHIAALPSFAIPIKEILPAA